LILSHPLPYLRSVAEAWVSFWPVPFYALHDKFTVPAAARAVDAIWPLERILLLAANFLAIAASCWVLAGAVIRRLKGTIGLSAPLVLSSVIMAASVLQALVEYGENARYAIPTQSLAVALVLLAAWDLRAAFNARRANA
jgi:hypothetical protein